LIKVVVRVAPKDNRRGALTDYLFSRQAQNARTEAGPGGVRRDFVMSTDDQREAHPRIDGQGIALLLIAAMLAFVLGTGALWIVLR
jgi:hypothetical protein